MYAAMVFITACEPLCTIQAFDFVFIRSYRDTEDSKCNTVINVTFIKKNWIYRNENGI